MTDEELFDIYWNGVRLAKEDFLETHKLKNNKINKLNLLLKSAKIFISNGCDRECDELHDNSDNCRHDDWLDLYKEFRKGENDER